jgi:hypothetical protein
MDRFGSDTGEIIALSEAHAAALSVTSPRRKFRMPSLEQVLERIGPLPEEALFLGQAEDGSSVLLNLHDPKTGPLLIAGAEGTGKTQFLHSIAQFVQTTHSAQQIQFGVITNRVEEWPDWLAGPPECVGVFASHGSGAKRFVQSLAMWLRAGRTSGQSVLMLVDGLDELAGWDESTLACLQAVFARGTEKRVWPIVTLHPRNRARVEAWLELFHLHLLEFGLPWEPAGMALESQTGSQISPVDGPWFTLREGAGWLRFWIPSVSA